MLFRIKRELPILHLVYNDGQTAGGSWITGNFDVGDMEKLDKNLIILSGNALIST